MLIATEGQMDFIDPYIEGEFLQVDKNKCNK